MLVCLQALAHQYKRSLESIHDNLPHIDISLVVKQGYLQFEPPLEEVHVAHYKNQLKPLLAIPLNFKVSFVNTNLTDIMTGISHSTSTVLL